MKLVGATNWYIRGPFILVGVFYGIIATVVSILILYPILYFISLRIYQYFDNYGQTMFSYFNSHFLSITGLMITAGILLGTISSIVAMQHYLKKV
jgi:cell division transport system permease protein